MKASRPPLWSCEQCGQLIYTAEEKYQHEKGSGHMVSRLPAWRVLALSMEGRALELAKQVAERKGLSLEAYLEDVQRRASRQAVDKLAAARVIWLDAMKLGLVTGPRQG